MPANLAIVNDTVSMAYVGETPWHKCGAKLDVNTPIEVWQEKAGLNFEVKKADVSFVADLDNGLTRNVKADNRSVLYRSDTGDYLSVMSDNKYKIVQPREVMEFYEDLIAASEGEFDLETAGALDGGRKIWAMAKARKTTSIMGQDKILPYLLLTTSFDGTSATIGKFTSVRVVCENTLSLSLGRKENGGMVRIPHSRDFDPAVVKMELSLYRDQLADFNEAATKLATVNVDDRKAMDYFARLYGPKAIDNLTDELPDISDFSTNKKNTINDLMTAYFNGPGSDLLSARHTAWGLINAVTFYQDHEARTRSTDGNSTEQARFASSQFGAGARMKERAVNLANQMLEQAIAA